MFITKPPIPCNNLEKIPIRVFNKKVFIASGVFFNTSDNIEIFRFKGGNSGFNILAFDFNGKDAQVAHFQFKICRLRHPVCELPYLKSAASLQVQCHGCMPVSGFPSGIILHQGGLCLFFKDTDIDAKMPAIPLPGLCKIGNTNANLLDSTNNCRIHFFLLIKMP